MTSIYLALFFLGIVVIVYWARQNDKVPPDGRTKGLLRMRFSDVRGGDQPGKAGSPPEARKTSDTPRSVSGLKRRP